MTTWKLVRFAYLPSGTLGRLFREEGAKTLYTIERPWHNNAPFESCIPEGEYPLAPFTGNRWKGVIEVCEVPRRTFILFHPGNSSSDVHGCIAPGEDWYIEGGGNPKVKRSKIAFNSIMDDFLLNGETNGEIILTISSLSAKLSLDN